MTTQGASPAPKPDKCALLVTCVECGEGVEVPLPTDHRAIALLLAQRGWHMSVLTPPGQGPEPVVFGVLCNACAPKVYPPEVMKIAEERRRQLLAAQPPQGAR